ncbi:MAG: transcription antiterminator BglG, partial [Eubacteriales bacterium]|nr:transcription antiterminator BglG [Eubacteriales bacterium]
PYFKWIHLVFVMLLPVDDYIRVNSEILGYISSILIEDYDFLMTITGGDKSEIESALSKHLRKFFNQTLAKYSE